MGKSDVLRILRENLPRIQDFGVSRIAIFGSAARDELGPDSDIDILAEFKPVELNFDNYMDLKFFLEKLFDRRVDLLTPDVFQEWLSNQSTPNLVYAA